MAKSSRELTDLQLDVMRVLWSRGEATAAEVLEELKPRRRLAATTVATLLSRLEKRGVVEHRVDGRTYVYRACASEGEVRRSLVGRIKQAFAGDLTALLAQLLDDSAISAADLARVREMIQARERELGGSNE
jgi:predicted transcriptional regulator